nr:plant UBX domain-containing protein 4-like [Ipomoea batatas]
MILVASCFSGMLVQDPTKHNDVDAIFDQARQLGAVQGPLENLRPSSSSTSFTGVGRTLTGETVPPTAPQPPESVVHNIVFWRNGFTINDGPLRRLDDPENAPFLESIKKSECPKELEPADRRTSVHVNLIRRDENCPEPETRNVPFQGVGRTLGGSSNPATSEPTAATPLNTAPSPSMGIVVDKSLPSTSVQLRLADGTRMVAHFNNHHTVGDIRSFINASRPGGSGAYELQTGFPPKVLIVYQSAKALDLLTLRSSNQIAIFLYTCVPVAGFGRSDTALDLLTLRSFNQIAIFLYTCVPVAEFG